MSVDVEGLMYAHAKDVGISTCPLFARGASARAVHSLSVTPLVGWAVIPLAGLITVSHRPSLFKYHQFLLRLDGNNGWSFEELNQEQEVSDGDARGGPGSPQVLTGPPRERQPHVAAFILSFVLRLLQLLSITGEIQALTAKLAEVPRVQARLADVNRQLKL